MSSRPLTSSPLSSAQSSQVTFQTASSHTQPRYRAAQILPFELLQQIKVYLEESLFTQGLRFLQGLLTPVAADEKKRVPIPPPEYLTLLLTLTVHPSFTSRASTQEKTSQSNAALKILWIINKTTGPVNSRLSEAYRFRRYDPHPSRSGETDADSGDETHEDQLNSSYADDESLLSLAEDFWAVIGWALNTSCLPGIYATRWKYWQPYLEYMLDVIETDWELREETDSNTHSILAQYIKSATGGTARGRRILRAIFADGSPASLKEFREIFRKELKEPKSDNDKKKQQEPAVDVDKEIYGDWMQEEDTSTDEDASTKRDDILQPRPAKRLRTRTPRATKRSFITETDDSDVSMQDEQDTARGFGPPESIKIRLRLLQLLSNFSTNVSMMTPGPEPIFPDLHELYTLFVEFIRPLPLSAFQSIILPTNPSDRSLQSESRIALCEFILQRLVDSDSDNQRLSTFEPMTQERLVTEYLPYAAVKNTVEAQAKVSLLLESVLRQLAKGNNDVLRKTPDLVRAVQSGIEKREAKADAIRDSARPRKGTGQETEVTQHMLRESATRMKFVVENFLLD